MDYLKIKTKILSLVIIFFLLFTLLGLFQPSKVFAVTNISIINTSCNTVQTTNSGILIFGLGETGYSQQVNYTGPTTGNSAIINMFMPWGVPIPQSGILQDGYYNLDAIQHNGSTIQSTWNNGCPMIVDTKAPVPTISQGNTQADPTTNTTIHFKVSVKNGPDAIDDNINPSTISTSDFTLGGTGTGTITSATWVGTPTPYANSGAYIDVVVTATAPGTFILNLAANQFADVAARQNVPATIADNTVTVTPPDTTPPTVTVEQKAGQADPTKVSPVEFTVTFSEAMNATSFTASDITFSGTATRGAATISTTDNITWNVSVPVTTSGTVIAAIAAGVATDVAGNNNVASTSTDNTITFDNIAPVAPTINLPVCNGTLNYNNPTISGTNEAGATVTITMLAPLFQIHLATVTGTTWTYSHAAITPDGTYSFEVRQTDAAGNISPATTSCNFTIDTTKPTTPVVTTNPVSTCGGKTNDNTPTISGTGEANATITISLTTPAVANYTTVVTAGGTWTYTFAILADGIYTYTIKQTDVAGNISIATAACSFEVDTIKPSVTVNQAATQVDPATVSPVSFTIVFSEAIDPATFTVTDITFSGTATRGTSTLTTLNNITWTLSVPLTTGGTVIATIAANTAKDIATNDNLASTSTDNQITYSILDTTPPLAPVVSAPTCGITVTNPKPTISGTGEIGATVTISITTPIVRTDNTIVDASGNWSFTYPSSLADGTYAFTVKQTDLAGNIGPSTANCNFIVIADTDGDGIPDSTENTCPAGKTCTNPPNDDADPKPNNDDLDSDDDGIPDDKESGCVAGTICTSPKDDDGDGTPDYRDNDSDNDGIPDDKESGCPAASVCNNPIDSDGDGKPNYIDNDSDNDGIPDNKESGCAVGTICTNPIDTDSDGKPNYIDNDSDGDGIPDNKESGCAVGTVCTNPIDTDSDGKPDYLDLDADADGLSDIDESGCKVGSICTSPKDSDNNGIPDFQQARLLIKITDPYVCNGNIHGTVSGYGNTKKINLKLYKTSDNSLVYEFKDIMPDASGNWKFDIDYKNTSATNYVSADDYKVVYSVNDDLGNTDSGNYTAKITNQCMAKTGEGFGIFHITGAIFLIIFSILGIKKYRYF